MPLEKPSIQKSSESEISQQLSYLRDTFPKNIASAKSVSLDQAKIEAEREISRLINDEYEDYFFTAFTDSQPMGYTWLRSQHEELFITYLYVSQSFRRRGMGSYILSWIENFAVEEGYRRVGLVVFAMNESAVSLYERNGYAIGNMKMTKRITS